MVTPPKTPPSKVAARKVTPVARKIAPAAPVEKPMPFVIETEESLLANIDPVATGATGATVADPLPKPDDQAPVPEFPAPAMTAEPAALSSVTEIDTPTPSQPVVVEPVVAAIESPAQWQAPTALEGHYIMNEAIETGKKFAEDAKARLQSIVGDLNEKAKVAVEKSSKTVEELTDITKGNVEALVESSKIAAKGVESLGQSAAEYGRASFEKTSATLKSYASVKSPVEFFQLQSELFTSAFDTLASETSKTSEALLKLAGEIAQPLSNRAAVVSDKLKALAA